MIRQIAPGVIGKNNKGRSSSRMVAVFTKEWTNTLVPIQNRMPVA
jgi:hypothetical protein